MVVGCRTQQLLKNGKNVSTSFTSYVSMYSAVGVRYKNYVKTTVQPTSSKNAFVRLYCVCKRLYSTDYQWPSEIKASFTKLTAQETVLLRHIPSTFAVETSAASDEIESLVQAVNVHVGQQLLVISDGTVHLDTNVLRLALTEWVDSVINDKYKGNALLTFPLKRAANLEINRRTEDLKGLLGDKGIPLSSLGSILTHGRSRRSIPSAIAGVSKGIFKFILRFINTEINNRLLNLSNNVMALYITDIPTHPVLKRAALLSNRVVKEVALVITHIRSGINHVFDVVIDGKQSNSTTVPEIKGSNLTTPQTPVRVKRDLVEFWLEDVIDTVSLEEQVGVPHNRRRRDLSTTIGEFIVKIKKVVISFTGILNVSLKEYISVRLNKTVYVSVGKAIVSPLIKVCDGVINVLLPCGNCTSLA